MKKYVEYWAAETERINTANGWFDGERSYLAGVALIHSEISEALEAYREWGMRDVTLPAAVNAHGGTPIPSKPEGVGSELADTVIRVFDQINRHCPDTLINFPGEEVIFTGLKPRDEKTFPETVAALHFGCSTALSLRSLLISILRAMHAHGFDPTFEVERKLAFNETRGYRHGNKIL